MDNKQEKIDNDVEQIKSEMERLRDENEAEKEVERAEKAEDANTAGTEQAEKEENKEEETKAKDKKKKVKKKRDKTKVFMAVAIPLCAVCAVGAIGLNIAIHKDDMKDFMKQGNGVEILSENTIDNDSMLGIGYMATVDEKGYGFVASMDMENRPDVVRLSNKDYYIDIMHSDDTEGLFNQIVSELEEGKQTNGKYSKSDSVEKEKIMKVMEILGDNAYAKDGNFDVHVIKSGKYVTVMIDTTEGINKKELNKLCYRLNKYIDGGK